MQTTCFYLNKMGNLLGFSEHGSTARGRAIEERESHPPREAV